MQKFLVTCNPGLEDIVYAEVRDTNAVAEARKFFDFQGHVEVVNISLPELFQLRSIDQIIEIKDAFYFDKTLDSLSERVADSDIGELDTAGSFRVSTRRFGNHSFGSHEVQAVIGEVLRKRYNQTVSLKEYEVHIKLDVIASFAYIGIQHTPEKYQKRFRMDYLHRAGIKPSVAYALQRLACIRSGQTILDPFCGAGTIPLEVAHHYKDQVKILGGDLYEDVLEGARNNAYLNELGDYIQYQQMNVFTLPEYLQDPVDVIISNPPYGVKSATKSNMRKLIRVFIVNAARVLKKEGKMVILMQRADMFRQTILRTKLFKITEERVVESGSLYPHLFVLGKIDDPDPDKHP